MQTVDPEARIPKPTIVKSYKGLYHNLQVALNPKVALKTLKLPGPETILLRRSRV